MVKGGGVEDDVEQSCVVSVEEMVKREPVHNVYIVQFFFPSTERGQTYLKISVLSYHSTYICPSSFDRGENGENLISVTLKL